MTIRVNPIAHSYWRRIKDGARTFLATPSNLQNDVLLLAKTDVEYNTITPEEYESFVGLPYVQ